jgi:hypothetical protein
MPDENGFKTEEDVLDVFKRLGIYLKPDPAGTALFEEAVTTMLEVMASPAHGCVDPNVFEPLQEVVDWNPSEALQRHWKERGL